MRVASPALKPSTKPIIIARAAGDRRRANAGRRSTSITATSSSGRSSMHRLRLHPGFLRGAHAPAARALVALRVPAQPRAGVGQRAHQVRRPPMHELGARLDGGRPARQAQRVDAPADARPRLEHDHAQPRLHQAAGRFQASHARADDDDVRVARVTRGSTGHGRNNDRRDAH